MRWAWWFCFVFLLIVATGISPQLELRVYGPAALPGYNVPALAVSVVVGLGLAAGGACCFERYKV